MAGRKSDFTLPTNTLDELFSSQEERDEAKLSKIRDIPLEEIDDFPDHPFQVREDEDMFQLVESIKERGVITPATVRVAKRALNFLSFLSFSLRFLTASFKLNFFIVFYLIFLDS